MSIIKQPEEIVRERMIKCADECTEQFKSSVLPIYGCCSQEGNPEHIGTCILLKLGQENYLLTAAHIIDERKYSLYLSTGSGLELLEGEFFITNKPNGYRDYDFYDFAWMKISTDFLSKLEKVKFIDEKNFVFDQGNVDRRLLIALGYPNSKNKKDDIQNKIVKPKIQPFCSIEKPNSGLCKKLGISGREHLFFSFDSKYSKNSDGFKVKSIKPIGMSGGALIDMGIIKPGHLAPGTPCNGKLAGMMIENHKEYKTILAVKIAVIINQIKRRLQSFSS